MRDIPILNLRDVDLRYGTRQVLRGLSIDICRYDKLTLVGHNGCGKTTLLKILANKLQPDAGTRYEEPGLSIGYVPQEPTVEDTYPTVGAYLASLLSDPAHFYKAEALAQDLGVDLTQQPQVLSGGEGRRVALVAAFMENPDILLLDEPTNHLDLAAITWLEGALLDYNGAFIVISHDRAFLKNITSSVAWLDRGHIRRLDKGFASFEDWQHNLIEEEVKQTKRLGKLLEKEQRWLHRGVTARRRRNQGRLRRLSDLRATRASMLRQSRSANWALPKEISASQVIIEAFAISKAFGGPPLVKEFSTRILHGDRIGIIGPNGTGKSTLLKLLTGMLPPDSGVVRLGKRVDVVYMDQQRSELIPTKSVKEILCPSGGDHIKIGDKHKHVVAYLKDFMFRPEQAEALVSTLSGGEKNRLLLAKSLTLPSSIMVLDEPTNDLDMDTLDMLQNLLDDYAGTLLVVSHDRDFLDQTVTSIIAFEGDGKIMEHAGGYSDYLTYSSKGIPAGMVKGKNLGSSALRGPRRRPSPGLDASGGSADDHSGDAWLKENDPLGFQDSTEPGAGRQPQRRERLSYKDVFRLETLPGTIADLRDRLADLHQRLADPDLYTSHPDVFDALSCEAATLQHSLEKLEEEWLALAVKHEEVGR